MRRSCTVLNQLGKRARNVTVVSSDKQVQQAARAVHAGVLSSKGFIDEWESLSTEEPAFDPRNRLLSAEEVADWEAFFQHGHPRSPKE